MVLAEAVYLRDFAKGSQVIIRDHDLFQMVNETKMRISIYESVFHTGIISFHMARETREAQWLKIGTNIVAQYEQWSRINASNFRQRHLVLGHAAAALEHARVRRDAHVDVEPHRLLSLLGLRPAHRRGRPDGPDRGRGRP